MIFSDMCKNYDTGHVQLYLFDSLRPFCIKMCLVPSEQVQNAMALIIVGNQWIRSIDWLENAMALIIAFT